MNSKYKINKIVVKKKIKYKKFIYYCGLIDSNYLHVKILNFGTISIKCYLCRSWILNVKAKEKTKKFSQYQTGL